MTVVELPAPSAPVTGVRRSRIGRPRRVTRLALLVVLAAIVAVTGLFPVQLGGSTSYAITDGVSMLPTFHAGDLVVLRKEPAYRVGEVAAYHNAQLHVVVLHRIIAVEGGRYVFKGDNNRAADSYRPTKGQIVGREWLLVPGAGTVLLKLREPLVAAVLLGVLWFLSFSSGPKSRRQRRRHRHA